MNTMRWMTAMVLILATVWVVTGCGEKVEVMEVRVLPGVETLSVVSEAPLTIRVTTPDGSSGVFLRKADVPKMVQQTLDFRTGEVCAVYENRIGHDYVLKAKTGARLQFDVTITPADGVSSSKVFFVEAYGPPAKPTP